MMNAVIAFALWIVLAAGCAETDDEPVCEGLDEEACVAQGAACFPAHAREARTDDPFEFLECLVSSAECSDTDADTGGALFCASAELGTTIYEFSSSCTPPGWPMHSCGEI